MNSHWIGCSLRMVAFVCMTLAAMPAAAAILAGHWNFDEGLGATANDSSGNANHGTLLGASPAPTWAPGASGAIDDFALNFGSGDVLIGANGPRVFIPNSPSLQITGDQTVSFWAFANDLTKRVNPVNKAYAGEGTVTLETSGQYTYFYGVDGTDGSTYQGYAAPPGTVTAGNWELHTLVRDLNPSGPDTLTWYKNGAIVASTLALHDPAVAGTQPLFIGNGYEASFNGFVDDVAIFADALSAVHVRATYELATESGLTFDQGEVNDLIEAFEASSSVVVEGAIWEFTTGLVGAPGTVVSLGIDEFNAPQYAVILDFLGNGMQTVSLPEPSACVMVVLGSLALVRQRRRREASN